MGLNISDIQIQFRKRFGMANSLNMLLRIKIPPTQHKFLTFNKYV